MLGNANKGLGLGRGVVAYGLRNQLIPSVPRILSVLISGVLEISFVSLVEYCLMDFPLTSPMYDSFC